jgi:DNA-binding NarL/FixJ family response regulator
LPRNAAHVPNQQQVLTKMTRILIVDDHWLYADALEKEVLRLRPGAQCTWTPTLAAAMELLGARPPFDFVFLDLKLPDAHGADALTRMLALQPALKVVVISGYEDVRLMRETYEMGAIGFLQKAWEPPAFQRALEQLLSGGFYYPAESLERSVRRGPTSGLTPRETDVICELAQGISTKQIARKLGLAPTTVDKHIEQIRVKLGVRTRMQLVARIHELGTFRGPR